MRKLTSFVLSLLLFLTFTLSAAGVASASAVDMEPTGGMTTNGDASGSSGG